MDAPLLNMLATCLTPTAPTFAEAQRQLEAMRKHQLPDFVRALSDVIANPHVNSDIRQLAGVLMKNCFESDNKNNDPGSNILLQVPEEFLQYIKIQMLNVMKTGGEAQSVQASCYVISRIAELELRRQGWPEFFDIIISMIDPNDIEACRSSLTCMRYLIEDLATVYYNHGTEFLSKAECDRLLTSIVKGAYMSDNRSRKTVMICLQHLLPFVGSNMSVASERDTIVQAICFNSAPGNSLEVQAAANDCLVQLVSDYYSLIGPCLQLIVPILWQAIDSGIEEVAIPAFEFWNTICETEVDLEYEKPGENQRIIQQVITYLLPKILHTMTLHEYEDLDSDTWTLPMAAGVCLSLCSQAVKNDIVPSVLQFVKENFSSPMWNRREAAVLAYGYIMEGPDAETLRMLVGDSFNRLCEVLDDPSIAVQDTAAWTIGRIATFHCQVIIEHLGSLNDPASNMSRIIRALFKPARVAVNICWFFHELAEGVSKHVCPPELVDAIFPKVCEALVSRAKMEDATERNLFSSAYSSICSFITNVSDGCNAELLDMLLYFDRTLASMTPTDDDSPEMRSHRESICGVLQVLLMRVNQPTNVATLWWSLCKILQDDLCEDALLAVSALLNRVGAKEFSPYIQQLAEIVVSGIQRTDMTSSCKACVELTSDMARVMERQLMPYVPQIMEILLHTLADFNTPQKVKPPIVTAFGDIALAIGDGFTGYVEPTMQLLLQAASTSYEMGPVDNEEWIWYINDLREGVLLSFTGILYGQKAAKSLNNMRQYVSSMLQLIQQVVEAPNQYFSTGNYKLAVTLAGDLVAAFGSDLSIHLVNSSLLQSIVERLKQIEADNEPSLPECRERVNWLYKSLNIG